MCIRDRSAVQSPPRWGACPPQFEAPEMPWGGRSSCFGRSGAPQAFIYPGVFGFIVSGYFTISPSEEC
eukprot:6549846-Alexandrium_andersonii.AAC.1